MDGEGKLIWPNNNVYEGLFIQVISIRIKCMVMAYILGMIKENLKEAGQMVSKKEKENTQIKMGISNMVSGKMESELNGSQSQFNKLNES